jgi:hypothetical protein
MSLRSFPPLLLLDVDRISLLGVAIFVLVLSTLMKTSHGFIFQVDREHFTSDMFQLKSQAMEEMSEPELATPPLCHQSTSRRMSLFAMAGGLVSSFGYHVVEPCLAAPPETIGEVDGLGARLERALRKKPPRALRQRLNQDFAVLLMRSSYNALDELDCIPMVWLL